jgi:hypothetical protein
MNIKKALLFLFGLVMFFPFFLKAQVRNVIVERYYVSDENDATDTIDGSARTLPVGSKTYRVYIQLEQGSRLKKIYGDSNHFLKIASTDTFFNNINRPNAYFGYLINKTWFPDNPTLALDSWLTLGRGAKNYKGILKEEDTNGSFIGGMNNYGGTAGVSGGLLVNGNVDAGIPLTTADGFIPDTTTLSQWLDNGFKESGIDTTVFGSVNSGTQFISDTSFLQQNSGVTGDAVHNNILVAQLTTRGEISFELNIVVIDTNGNDIKYVADGNILLADERICPVLKYPSVCGCTDPAYIEYSPAYACQNSDSCRTRIVYGCLDPDACNYDPGVNFNIPALCCYPGFCNDRDIAVVCPQLANDVFRLYPNPAQNEITLELPGDEKEMRYEIYNAFGRKVSVGNLNTGEVSFKINISEFHSGVYMLILHKGDLTESRTFLKD